MLDMGGVAPAAAETRIDVGKNNKVRAVALDFHLLTRSIEERRQRALEEEQRGRNGEARKPKKSGPSLVAASSVTPDVSLVEKMAGLLNVRLGGDGPSLQSSKRAEEEDLSAILGSSSEERTKPADETRQPAPKSTSAPPHVDIRSKYAAKLRNKIDGGVAGLEVAKFEQEESVKRGDAALHLVARDLMSSEGMTQSARSSRWLAATGTGKLLSFLSGRSMRIALLPPPSTPTRPQTKDDVERTEREMEDLTRQLPNVRFELLVPDGRMGPALDGKREGTSESREGAAEDVLKRVLSKIDVPSPKFAVVSDRDDYLLAARDMGMYTCRIRPKDARRGKKFSTNYDVEDVCAVQDVIDDINGISFNAALKG